MPKYISGRSKLRNHERFTDDRYQYLSLDQAEPNLGNPPDGTPAKYGSANVPVGDRYQIVSVEGYPGERYWIPVEGGIIPGSLTVFDEDTTVVGGINSITQMNFIGAAITAFGFNLQKTTITLDASATHSFLSGGIVTQTDNPSARGIVFESTTLSGIVTLTDVQGQFLEAGNSGGTLYLNGTDINKTPGTVVDFQEVGAAATVKITPEYFSSNNQLIFNDNDEFSGSLGLVYYKNASTNNSNVGLASVGIGTTIPLRTLHVDGDIKLTGSIEDYNSSRGNLGDLLVKNNSGGIEWTDQRSVTVGAAGTFYEVQFHGATGYLNGADKLVYRSDTQRIGIGSTQPTKLLDVLGDSIFTGDVNFNRTNGISTITFDKSDGELKFDNHSSRLTFGVDDDLQIYYDGTETNTAETTLVLRSNIFTTYNGSAGDVITQFNTNGIDVLGSGKLKYDYTSATNTIVLYDVTGYFTTTNNSAYNIHYGATNTGTNVSSSTPVASYSSYIDSKEGPLYIRNNVAGDTNSDIIIQARSGENSILCMDDGQVYLYYNGSSKAYTDTSGFTVSGRLYVTSGESVFADDVNFDGTGSSQALGNADADMNWDRSQSALKFEDGASIKIGSSDDLRIFHTDPAGTVLGILSTSNNTNLSIGASCLKTGIQTAIRVDYNPTGTIAHAELWCDGTKQLETISTGATIYGVARASALRIVGIATIDNVRIGESDNKIDTIEGNLILDSTGGTVQVDDVLYVNNDTDSTNTDSGSIYTQGGVGIDKNLSVGGITTTNHLKVVGMSTAETHLNVLGITSTNHLKVVGMSTAETNLNVLGITSTNNLNVVGVSTFLDKVGIKTDDPKTDFQVGSIYGVGVSSDVYTSSGTPYDIDSYDVSDTNFRTAEYTVHFENGSNIQAGKVLIMNNSSTAYIQEYAVMFEPNRIVNLTATKSGDNIKLQATREVGITGDIEYRFVRQTML